VGFISDLPTMLVAAFRATLEEVVEADVILHVRDIASSESPQQAEDVMRVLGELGIHAGEDRRIVEVWNKVDRLDAAQREALRSKAATAAPPAVLVSAATGEGMAELLARIERMLMAGRPTVTVELGAEQLGAAPWLYENTEVLERSDDPETGRARLKLRIAESRMRPFQDWARRQHVAVAASEAGSTG
jgi:GTP-binding protein HflX